MKRALKKQIEADQLFDHNMSGNNKTEISVPGGTVNSSGGLNDNNVASPTSLMQVQKQQPQQPQLNQTNSDDLRVVAPHRTILKIKSSPSPRTPSSPQSKKMKTNNGTNNRTSEGVKPTTATSSSSFSNPKKRSRPLSSGGNTPTTPSALTSPLPLPTIDDEEDDEQNEATNTKFYLKYQNQALASELYKYKHAISILEKERNVRREECRLIHGAMRDMVSYWNAMEGVLIGALGTGDNQNNPNSISLSSIGLTSSTGEGNDVENVYSIMQSIVQLSASAASLQAENETIQQKDDNNDDDDQNYLESDSLVEQRFMKHLSDATSSFSKRVTNFQRLVLNLVHQNASQSNNAKNDPDGKYLRELLKFGELKKTIAALQHSCQDLESKLEDMSKDRDVAKDSERKVRRGLYRAVSGRMKITEVLKAVEESSSLGVEDLDELQKDLLSTSSSKVKADTIGSGDVTMKGEETSPDASASESTAIVIDGKTLGVEDVMEMKKKIDNLTLINETRDKKISELMTIKDDMENRLTAFMAKDNEESVKEEDIMSSPIYIETASKLEVAEREKQKLQNDLQSVMDRWAVTKGDLDLSHKTICDLEEKHTRRLKELSGLEDEDGVTKMETTEDAKRVVELEHKLKHALETVRQAEALKSSLIDATKMKESLQRQVLDLKEANEQLEAAQTEINADLLSSSDDEKVKTLQKEFNALMQRKENAKRNLELSEKERDSLLAINVRLQQQMVDKDDMNAKSLSTILHLRQLNEQLEQEKSLVEKKLKSSEQLGVMIRLTTNAKDKVEREAMQQKELVEEELKQMQSNYEQMVHHNDKVQVELNLSNSQAEKARNDLQILKERCDNLVSKSSESEQQIKQLSESLVVAKKDAVEAMQKAAAAASASGSQDKFDSEFTAEQLTIQVNQLKSRLACPVCNTRDKKVIITRCRHMFCRHCVALNLENRNRKCPSCGIKFDKKDVEDVWF